MSDGTGPFGEDRQMGFAGFLAVGASPLAAWQEIRDALDSEAMKVIEALQATPAGAAALETSRAEWSEHGFVAPWLPAISTIDRAELGDTQELPEGSTASRCNACGETRVHRSDNRRDEWKHHFDHCTYPEISSAPEEQGK